jgi:ActR/RegA family two-component response regulator
VSQVPRALILDPEFTEYAACIRALKVRGWDVAEAPTLERAIPLLVSTTFNFVIQELQPPDADGMDAWSFIRKLHPDMFGIITTKLPSLRASVNPFAPGILAFMLKPPEAHIVAHLASIALEFQTLAAENRRFQSNLVGLSQLASSLAQTLSPERAVKTALAHLPAIVSADYAFIALLDRTLDPPEWSDWLFANHAQVAHLSRTQTILFQQLFDRLEATAHDQIPTSLTLAGDDYDAALTRAALSAVHLAPILVRDVLMGAFVVANAIESDHVFGFTQAQLCDIVAQLVGIVLQSQRASSPSSLDAEENLRE